jgi:glycosyltransferase involved in cell wall biosynthesis
MPDISVIMSVYNGQETVRNAINSILNQDYEKFEFLLVNDGSTDSTLEILEEYSNKDKRIRVINQENIGLTNTLNKLIKIAKSEFIARQDADDWSHPSRLNDQYIFLRTNPDIAMVGSWYKVHFGDNLEWLTQPKSDLGSLQDYLKRGINCFMHSSVMYRKNVIDKFDGPYRFRYAQDYDLWLRLSEKHHVGMLTKCLCSRIEGDAIISHVAANITPKLVESMRLLAKERKEFGKEISNWKELEKNTIKSVNLLRHDEQKIKLLKKKAFVSLLCGNKKLAVKLNWKLWKMEKRWQTMLLLVACLPPTIVIQLINDIVTKYKGGMPHKYSIKRIMT